MSEKQESYVISVRFRNSRKPYTFMTEIEGLKSGDQVVVESVYGYELAEVVNKAKPLSETRVIGELQAIVRQASEADVRQALANKEAAVSARRICEQSIAK